MFEDNFLSRAAQIAPFLNVSTIVAKKMPSQLPSVRFF